MNKLLGRSDVCVFENGEKLAYSTIFGDLLISLLPGVLFAISYVNLKFEYASTEEEARKLYKKDKLKDMVWSLVSVATIILWYLFYYGTNHKYKLSRIKIILIGNVISFALIITIGSYMINKKITMEKNKYVIM